MEMEKMIKILAIKETKMKWSTQIDLLIYYQLNKDERVEGKNSVQKESQKTGDWQRGYKCHKRE